MGKYGERAGVAAEQVWYVDRCDGRAGVLGSQVW